MSYVAKFKAIEKAYQDLLDPINFHYGVTTPRFISMSEENLNKRFKELLFDLEKALNINILKYGFSVINVYEQALFNSSLENRHEIIEVLRTICVSRRIFRQTFLEKIYRPFSRTSLVFQNSENTEEKNIEEELQRMGITQFTKLSKGGYGKVYSAKKDGHDVCIKLFFDCFWEDEEYCELPQSISHQYCGNEIIPVGLSHPNIIKIFEYIYGPPMIDIGSEKIVTTQVRGIVMERLSDVTLNKLIFSKPLSLKEIISFSVKVLGAIAFLHQNYIIHRDIKLPNIVLDARGEPVIIDSGIARRILDPNKFLEGDRYPCYYNAPEIRRNHLYDFKADMWSFGFLIYDMISLLQVSVRLRNLDMYYEDFYSHRNGRRVRLQDHFFEYELFFKEVVEDRFGSYNGIWLEIEQFLQKLIVIDTTKRFSTKEALKELLKIQKSLEAQEDIIPKPFDEES